MAKSGPEGAQNQTAAKSSARQRAMITAGSGLLAEPRRMKILAWLQEEGSARVRELSEALGVSEPTIRQDLEKLENEGHIVREHGGAFLRSAPQQVRGMALQHQVNMEAKRRIGRLAASLVADGQTLILDSGSTTTEVALNLLERLNLNVVTNALNIALILGARPSCTVHMPGGQFKAPTLSLSGERSAAYFEGLHAQTCFLATAAISLEAGLTYPSLADLPIKKAMIVAASHVCLVADSTKIGRISFSSLDGGVEVIQTLITDDGIRDDDRKAFEARGVRVLTA